MIKTCLEIKKNTVIFKSEDIIDTAFVKWFSDSTIEINNNSKKLLQKCGVCLKSTFESWNSIDNLPITFPVPCMYQGMGYVVAIRNDNMQDVMLCKKHITDIVEQVSIDNINSKEYTFYIFNSGSHELMDLNFNYISIPIYMDPTFTLLTNKNFDLKISLDKIKKCPFVCNPENIQISKIPYYNATSEENENIEFYIILPQKEYVKFQELEHPWDRYEFILNDVIGLKSKEAL